MNKRITIKKIMLMLYALLMCLPLINVGFRSLYVTFNKNAFESYYGETINEVVYNQLDNNNGLSLHGNYQLSIPLNSIQINYPTSIIEIGNITNFETNYSNNIDPSTITSININYNNDANANIFTIRRSGSLGTVYINMNSNYIHFNFELMNYSSLENWNYFYNYIYGIEYNKYSYLDNAFDYSLHEFIDNNNTGLINFVGLFSDMFLGNSNVENSLYLGFANFMMNYALFISCAYFVFEVLMWFINYCRKWLYAFEEKGGAE